MGVMKTISKIANSDKAIFVGRLLFIGGICVLEQKTRDMRNTLVKDSLDTTGMFFRQVQNTVSKKRKSLW